MRFLNISRAYKVMSIKKYQAVIIVSINIIYNTAILYTENKYTYTLWLGIW